MLLFSRSVVSNFWRPRGLFPASGSFLISQLFASGSQSIGASAIVLPVIIQDWSPLGLTGLISSLSKGFWRVFSTPQFKSISSWTLSLLYGPVLTSAHDYWKNHSFDYADFCQQSDVSAFQYAKFIIASLPRSKGLLISWQQLSPTVIL